MTIIVAGGAGFIGSNFIFYQLEHYPNDKIVCIDNLTYASNFSTLLPIINNSNFVFYKENICDKTRINEIFEKEKPDMVVNFAAESHVDRSIKNPEIFLKTNIMGTFSLLEACKRYGVKRYHQISTDEVYGELPKDKVGMAFCENNPIHSNNPYSCTKAAADLLVLVYYRTFKIPITISRCSNNYGPYQHPEKLIPIAICNALMNKKIPIHGDGTDIRDWIYVEDHCVAIDYILRKGKIGEIYNIGSHNEKRNLDVVKSIIYLLKKDTDLIKFTENRPCQDCRYAVDYSKIQKELNWFPLYDFDYGIRKTVDWYIANEKWWHDLIK